METFSYLVIDKAGSRHRGNIEAQDANKASSLLREKGYIVIDLKSRSRSLALPGLKLFQKVSEVEITNFTRLLATMISTGLPITVALQNLADQSENQLMKQVIGDILRDIQSGSSLSGAIERHDKIFSPVYISLVRSGEESGKLDKTLKRLSETLEKEREFKSKLKTAMIYPIIVVIAMLGVASLMMIVVVPKIADVYGEANAALPLPTRVLIGLSRLITSWWPVGLGLFAAAIFLLRSLKQTAQGEEFINELGFNLPIFGKLNRQVVMARLVGTLGVLVGSGVAILDALRLTAETLGTNSYQSRLHEASSGVEKGFALSASLRGDDKFPPIISQMIAVGEDTGTLDDVLAKLAVFFESETEFAVKNLTAALEPLIIVVMGIGVAGLAAAIILPLFNLVNVIK